MRVDTLEHYVKAATKLFAQPVEVRARVVEGEVKWEVLVVETREDK